MKTYAQEPKERYKTLRQLASIRRIAREYKIDLNNRNAKQHSTQDQLILGSFWMLIRLYKSKRDNVEF